MIPAEDRAKLDAWIREVAPRALAYARSLVGRSSLDADDIVQEAFLRALNHAREYNLPEDGIKILFRTISRLCINATVRSKNLASLESGGTDHSPMQLADPSADLPPEIAMGRELESRINHGMAQLPELQRAALELRALGQSKETIAEILEISVSHAGVLVHRARKSLAELLNVDLGKME